MGEDQINNCALANALYNSQSQNNSLSHNAYGSQLIRQQASSALQQSTQLAYSQALGSLLGSLTQGYIGTPNALLVGLEPSAPHLPPRVPSRTEVIAKMGFSGNRKVLRRRFL